jgi:DNA modification methylase/NAD-dependent dihydropyrimidine dehydrogenase PreA subunit
MGKEWDSFKQGRAAKYQRGGELISVEQIEERRGKGGAGPSYVNRPAKRCKKCGKQAWSGSPCKCEQPEWELDNSPLHAAQEWHQAWATEALRVLKPGGHLLAFGGTRTYHRLACAVEDAGFEIRDSLIWLYGSGFPKSLDVSRAIDKANGRSFEQRFALGRHIRGRREAMGLARAEVNAWLGAATKCEHYESESAGFARVPTLADWNILSDRLGLSPDFLPLVERVEAEREVVGPGGRSGQRRSAMAGDFAGEWDDTAPATPEAAQWEGWGTALKPAHEPIVVARKPLSGTVAQNVLSFGTGALNIDGCRIGTGEDKGEWPITERRHADVAYTLQPTETDRTSGRWPANVVLSHLSECERVGVRKVDSNARKDKAGGCEFFHGGDARESAPWGEPDGTETVHAYECAENCPIRELDEQSGERGANGGEGDFEQHAWMRDDIRQRITPQSIERSKGGASRFFLTVQPDTLCGLCNLPCVESAGNPSPPNEALSDTAPGSVQGEPSRGSEGSSQQSSIRAKSAVSDLANTSAPEQHAATAPPDAQDKLAEWIVQLASFAERLCNECATSTAQSVARWLIDPTQESQAGPVSTLEQRRQTLSRSLALIAVGSQQSGIIPTTAELSMSFGSAVAVTGSVTAAMGMDSSRFAYQAKSSRGERNAGLEGFEERETRGNYGDGIQDARPHTREGYEYRAVTKNGHPTVKPIDLMRWLVRLVTPPGGRILDPFAGSGTTGIAAALEGFDFIGIEREPEYCEIARARIAWWEHHQGREANEVLAESRRSEILRERHESAGQLGLEVDTPVVAKSRVRMTDPAEEREDTGFRQRPGRIRDYGD